MGPVRAGDARLRPESPRHPARRRSTELARQPRIDTRDLRVSPASKLVFKLAHHHATRAGRQALESTDLFAALFEDSQGVPAAIMRKAGIEPESLVSRITARVRDIERDDERLKKQFELPPFLKHFATNLNLLARQDRLPPVFGRVHEIQQAVEILSHRERANSVMLIGEPGVGKTAIAEGLARRIEFEAESLPARLRDCQIVEPAVEQPGGRHHAARHVRGPHPERAPRAEGAAEPDSLHRRGAHAHRRGFGAGRAGRCGQRPEGRARPR